MQLQDNPKSSRLYFQRAELHGLHADWTNAATDFATALKLEPEFLAVYLARGRMLYEAGRLTDALQDLNHFLKLRPAEPEGYSVRARVLNALGRYPEAASDFDRAIGASPSIADYLDRARALAACGTNRLDEALRGLVQALERSRNSLMIQDLAIELELKRLNFTNALKRLDGNFANLPRKEWWQGRRAEILEKAGQRTEAVAAYRER